MTRTIVTVIQFVLTVSILSFAHAESTPPSHYNKMNSACRVCNKINALLVKYSETSDGNKRLNLTIEIGAVIKTLWTSRSRPPALYTDIYYSLNASIEVLNYDMDSETVTHLLRVRQKYPKEFDYVFWRFPRVSQERILQRMQILVKEGVNPKAKLPIIKVEED